MGVNTDELSVRSGKVVMIFNFWNITNDVLECERWNPHWLIQLVGRENAERCGEHVDDCSR